jgi:hypothetical protein
VRISLITLVVLSFSPIHLFASNCVDFSGKYLRTLRGGEISTEIWHQKRCEAIDIEGKVGSSRSYKDTVPLDGKPNQTWDYCKYGVCSVQEFRTVQIDSTSLSANEYLVFNVNPPRVIRGLSTAKLDGAGNINWTQSFYKGSPSNIYKTTTETYTRISN